MRARVCVELPHRVADVRARRLRRDVEAPADLLVAHAVGEQPQDLALPLRQHRQLLGRFPAREYSREYGVDVDATLRDRLDRANQVGERRLLEDEAAHARVARRATAIPDIPGIRRSTIDTCGLRSSIALSASSPSRACATTSKPWLARTREIESRTAGWSSASKQVIVSGSVMGGDVPGELTVVTRVPPSDSGWIGSRAPRRRRRGRPGRTASPSPPAGA